MKVKLVKPPRLFKPRPISAIKIKDCARILLAPNEQVTFLTKSKGEYDVARKSWGFYATPSMNGRLAKHGFKVALAKSIEGKFFILLVERSRQGQFNAYRKSEKLKIIRWF